MRHRVIREAMKEAHENVDNYGGVWYVLDDDFMSVVKESYFITDEGDRKVKPFVCLYNTKDMRYGMHTIQWIDGEIVIDSKDVKERFEQPYGTKYVEEKNVVRKSRSVGISTTLPPSPIIIGDSHASSVNALRRALEIARMHDRLEDAMVIPTGDLIDDFKERGIDIKTVSKPFVIDMPYNMKDWFDEPFIEARKFDMATGKMVIDEIPKAMSEAKRKALRKKRKKRRK